MALPLRAQLLMSDDFTSYSNGTLTGQGAWTTKNSSNLVLNVTNTTPLTYAGYNGGGGRYVVPSAGSIPYNQRLQYPTTNWAATGSQKFFVSFLVRVSSVG